MKERVRCLHSWANDARHSINKLVGNLHALKSNTNELYEPYLCVSNPCIFSQWWLNKAFITMLWLTICMLTKRVRVFVFLFARKTKNQKKKTTKFAFLKTAWNFFCTHSPELMRTNKSLLRTRIYCIEKTGQMFLSFFLFFFSTKSIWLCQFVRKWE